GEPALAQPFLDAPLELLEWEVVGTIGDRHVYEVAHSCLLCRIDERQHAVEIYILERVLGPHDAGGGRDHRLLSLASAPQRLVPGEVARNRHDVAPAKQLRL